MNLVKYANDCFSETYCYIEVVFLGSAKFRWNRERERRRLNHVLIWFAEVTCLSDTPHAKKRSYWVGERKNRREGETESKSESDC